jgi:outer membrane protein
MKAYRASSFLLAAAISCSVSAAQTTQSASPAAPLTVGDAVALVLARNPALTESDRAIDASRARAGLSRSGYLPTAAVEATYVFLAPVSVFDLPGESIKVFPYNNYDGHVGVQQTIYDFQKTSSQVGLADSRVTLAEDSRDAVKRDLGVRAAETFYAILFLRRSIEVQNEQVRTLGEHLAITRRKAEAGTATQLDELTTQVRVAAAQNVKIGLENSLRSAEIALRGLAALPSDSPLDLRGDFTAQAAPSNRDSLVNSALAGRIEARSANDALASARALERAAGTGEAPSLSASLMYGVKNGYIPNLDVLRGNVVGALSLRVPLFDGNRTSAMEEEATAAIHQAEARKQEVALMIQSEVDQAISDIRAANERVSVSQTNINQADLAAANARLRYDAGSISNVDLLDAETAVAQARLTNLQALYDIVTGTIRLHRATGSPLTGG